MKSVSKILFSWVLILCLANAGDFSSLNNDELKNAIVTLEEKDIKAFMDEVRKRTEDMKVKDARIFKSEIKNLMGTKMQLSCSSKKQEFCPKRKEMRKKYNCNDQNTCNNDATKCQGPN